MHTYTAPVPAYDLPLTMSDRADAANRALRAGFETAEVARSTWAEVSESVDTRTPLDQMPKGSTNALARRLAVRLDQSVRRVYGLVSGSAAGLVGVTVHGRVGEVEDTTSGSDYLDGVQWIEWDGAQWTKGRKEEVPVSEFVVFFDTRDEAREFLFPTPRKRLFG